MTHSDNIPMLRPRHLLRAAGGSSKRPRRRKDHQHLLELDRLRAARIRRLHDEQVWALTTIRILARELGPRGIAANSIMVGAIGSGFLDPAGETLRSLPTETVREFMRTVESHTPAERIGQPSDIAPIAASLASPQAGWISGQTILANDGRTA